MGAETLALVSLGLFYVAVNLKDDDYIRVLSFVAAVFTALGALFGEAYPTKLGGFAEGLAVAFALLIMAGFLLVVFIRFTPAILDWLRRNIR